MVSMQFVLQPLPGTDEQFIDRIREVSDKVNRFGSGTHRIFEQLKIPVREVVIGPNHIGVLLEDGKAFRVAFSINSEKLDLTKSDNKCAPSGGVAASNAPKAPSSSRPMARSRARLLRATGRTSSSGQGSGSRSTGVIIGGSSSNRPLVTVPATYVPEELISQAEVVLQGKSRNLIIRELQRTNLDVNLAVNNLLSRDDEEAEDTEEGGDNYVPEDLISLLDNGFSGDNSSVIIDPSDGLFSEEIFSNYSSIRNLLFDRIRSERTNASSSGTDNNQSNRASASSSGVISASQISSANADREAFSRWRDRQYYGPRRWINKDDYTWDKETDPKKKEPSSMPSPIWISEEWQPWPDKNGVRFKTIGALYSEFIALSENGELHQWRWSDLEPYKSDTENVYHPKTLALNITEKVELISANFIRCSVVTESNRVATWMDEQLGYLGAKLEHVATAFNEFNMDPIATIHVCSLYTAVRTDNNNIYWWGVLPFDQRRYLWDKFRTKTKKPFKVVAADINAPPVQASTSNKSGQISSTSKESTDRIDMPPPPSPASSTCSDTGSVTSHKRTKRMTAKEDGSNCQEGRKDEELWQLKDVVFVEDKVGPIGKVLKVDGDYVAVRFPPLNCVNNVNVNVAAGSTTKDEGKEDDWQLCRLLRREDVQIFRSAVSSRGPDWLQKQPKKINIGADLSSAQLLTIAVDTRGIHAIKKVFGKIHYSLYNLYNSKQEQSCQFPTDCASFIGASANNITMACNNDCNGNSSTIVLRDGNGALYPLAKDCIGSIKDPQWFDLPPVKSITMATISLPPSASCINLKSKVCMTALLFVTQKLMPHILRCDIKNCISVLKRLEQEDRQETIAVVEERCDGNRNIFHACVIMCAPNSNKDSQHSPDLTSTSSEKKPLATGVSLPRTGPGGSSLPYGSAFAGNGGNFNENSSFATVSAGINAPSTSSSSITRENRISLRDMMHRLINTEQNTEQNHQASTSAGEDHAYIPLPWTVESGTASNLSTTGAQNSADIADDDVSKVLPSTSQNMNVSNSKLVKCTSDHLDTLLLTLVRELQNFVIEDRCKEAEEVARRFVRSVARVFVIFNLEKQPNPEKRKNHTSCNKYVQSCVKVFQTLHKISIEELCEVSEALIAPVRLGVVRPTAPFAMSSSNLDNSDDLFSVEPLAPSNVESTSEHIVHDAINAQSSSFSVQQNYDVVAMDTLRDPSESEEIPNRENNLSSHDDDLIENQRNEEGMQDDESDNDFTFNDAETESDSDDNQSNQDAQRSVQTGATVGSETDIGVLFLEDESGDSSAQEEDGSEDGESDDQSDEFSFNDQQLERRNINPNSRNDLTPQTMQWAIRSRDNTRPSVRVPTGSNLVFIDPMALRRTTVPASTAVNTPTAESHTMATTASNLGRAFGITIRQISELLGIMSYNMMNDIETSLKIQIEEAVAVQAFVEKRLKPTWDWMFTVMDGTEAQLKFGAYLTNYTDPNHPLHPLNLSQQATTSQASTPPSTTVGVNVIGSNSRRDFFTYCLSLMRAHTSEHRDALPVLDITALRHIAYVLDAFVFYMRNDTSFYDKSESISGRVNNLSNSVENDDTDDELSNIEDSNAERQCNIYSIGNTRKYAFFTRSDSTLSLGCSAPDGFDLPLDMAMPLADKPHLLQPNSKRQELFANLPLHAVPASKTNTKSNNSHQSSIDQPPTRLGFSNFMKIETSFNTNTNEEPTVSHINTEALEPKKENNTYKDDDTADSNIYVQLKKKQCLDDSKSQEGDKDNKYVDDDMDGEDVHMVDDTAGSSRSADLLITTRPEVIIAPTKSQTRSGIREDVTPMQSSLSVSAVRSVIVRAGASSLKVESDDNNLTDLRNQSSTASQMAQQLKCDNSREKVPNQAMMFPIRGSLFYKSSSTELPSWNFLLSRWKLALDLFGRVFMDDVGMEHGSVLPELRGFPVKEMRFRRHMEKLRNGQQRDLVLCKLERNRDSLIIQTFKELNAQFGTQNRRAQPPITFNRVKVTFKDEPGEGSGVARSFYTSISEALLASAKLPNLDSVQVGGTQSKYGVPFSSILRSRTVSGSSRDPPTLQRRGTGSKILWRTARERKSLNVDARPYTPAINADNTSDSSNDHLSVHLQQLGERLYPKIHSINSTHAPKVTGMLLEIPTPQLLSVLSSDETLRQKVNEAVEIISFKQKSEVNVQSQQKKSPSAALVEPMEDDNEPLFYSPGKRGFYTPRQGLASFERINAFRNIGRLIGLCLLQNELLPLFLQRHVLKYMLGRKIKFHDLAFFDPALYESFRQIIQNAPTKEGEENINRMELSFVIDLMKEEGCGNRELIPGGRDIPVTSSNIFEYIRRYTEYRLIKSQEKALEALKDGIFDVLPDNCMNSLTAEDLRLLLNGVGDINMVLEHCRKNEYIRTSRFGIFLDWITSITSFGGRVSTTTICYHTPCR
ncbi:hypothetical protein ACLKA6_003892 [Drosophila palustris]